MELWRFIRGLEGVTIRTLDPTRSQPFLVQKVSDEGVLLWTAGGSRVFIRQEMFLDSWVALEHAGSIDLNIDMHCDLGLRRASSYVAAMLARVPGVLVHTRPIVLEYRSA